MRLKLALYPQEPVTHLQERRTVERRFLRLGLHTQTTQSANGCVGRRTECNEIAAMMVSVQLQKSAKCRRTGQLRENLGLADCLRHFLALRL